MPTYIIRSRDVRAAGIYANIEGAADVAVLIFTLDNLVQENGGKAVSASVWRGPGESGLFIGGYGVGGTHTSFPYRSYY